MLLIWHPNRNKRDIEVLVGHIVLLGPLLLGGGGGGGAVLVEYYLLRFSHELSSICMCTLFE